MWPLYHKWTTSSANPCLYLSFHSSVYHMKNKYYVLDITLISLSGLMTVNIGTLDMNRDIVLLIQGPFCTISRCNKFAKIRVNGFTYQIGQAQSGVMSKKYDQQPAATFISHRKCCEDKCMSLDVKYIFISLNKLYSMPNFIAFSQHYEQLELKLGLYDF